MTKNAVDPPPVCKNGPIKFQVVPAEGLRSDYVEFILGTPLNMIITMLQQHNTLMNKLQLSFPSKNPFDRDVCIDLTMDGIRLYFEPVTQLLRLIEVYRLDLIVLQYRKSTFSEPGSEASMEKVIECFGSTHPGAYDDKQKMYVQSWPGLSFCFPTNDSDHVENAPGFGPNLRSLKYDASSQRHLTKISIYAGHDLAKPEQVKVPLSCYCAQNLTKFVEATWEDGKIVGINVTFEAQTGEKEKGEFKVEEITRTVRFGDTTAAVQATLGAPNKVFYKAEDKMRIHYASRTDSYQMKNKPHFFFNYFSMGFDILFDFESKRVVKFVLHTNIPGHFDFSIYHRCNFSVFLNNELPPITTTSKFSDFSLAFLDQKTGNVAQPVVLQHCSGQESNPFPTTLCYGVHQLVVEVLENEHIAGITLYDDKL